MITPSSLTANTRLCYNNMKKKSEFPSVSIPTVCKKRESMLSHAD